MGDKVKFLLLSILFLGTVSVFAGNVFVSENGVQANFISENGSVGVTESFVCVDASGANRTLVFENGLLVNASGGVVSNESNESIQTISSHATLGNGLVSYYSLDETSGSTLGDAHGSNPLTISGSPDLDVDGKIVSGIDVRGNAYTDHAYTTSFPAFTGSGITISGWANLDEASNVDYGVLAELKSTSGNNYFDIQQRTDWGGWGMSFFGNSQSWVQPYETTGKSANTWHHIVAVYDEATSEARFYVDGNHVQTLTATGGFVESTMKFYIGRAVDGDWNEPDGTLDEIGVWNRSLTAGEISDLYNNGGGLAYE